MAVALAPTPVVTLATLVDALDLSGDQVYKAKQAGIYTMGDIITAMCDPANVRRMANGDRLIDLALMDFIDDDTSDALETVAMAFTPRPANLTAVVGPVGTGANPAVTGHGNTPGQTQPNSLQRFWKGLAGK